MKYYFNYLNYIFLCIKHAISIQILDAISLKVILEYVNALNLLPSLYLSLKSYDWMFFSKGYCIFVLILQLKVLSIKFMLIDFKLAFLSDVQVTLGCRQTIIFLIHSLPVLGYLVTSENAVKCTRVSMPTLSFELFKYLYQIFSHVLSFASLAVLFSKYFF